MSHLKKWDILPITKIIDEYYKEIQNNGGNRFDTSSLMTLVDQ